MTGASRAPRCTIARDAGKIFLKAKSRGAPKMPVHHIHMNPIGATPLGLKHLLARAREVGCEDGRGYSNRAL